MTNRATVFLIICAINPHTTIGAFFAFLPNAYIISFFVVLNKRLALRRQMDHETQTYRTRTVSVVFLALSTYPTALFPCFLWPALALHRSPNYFVYALPRSDQQGKDTYGLRAKKGVQAAGNIQVTTETFRHVSRRQCDSKKGKAEIQVDAAAMDDSSETDKNSLSKDNLQVLHYSSSQTRLTHPDK